MLSAGERVGVAEVGILATVGAVELPVHRRPKVAVLSTGAVLIIYSFYLLFVHSIFYLSILSTIYSFYLLSKFNGFFVYCSLTVFYLFILYMLLFFVFACGGGGGGGGGGLAVQLPVHRRPKVAVLSTGAVLFNLFIYLLLLIQYSIYSFYLLFIHCIYYLKLMVVLF